MPPPSLFKSQGSAPPSPLKPQGSSAPPSLITLLAAARKDRVAQHPVPLACPRKGHRDSEAFCLTSLAAPRPRASRHLRDPWAHPQSVPPAHLHILLRRRRQTTGVDRLGAACRGTAITVWSTAGLNKASVEHVATLTQQSYSQQQQQQQQKALSQNVDSCAKFRVVLCSSPCFKIPHPSPLDSYVPVPRA